MNWAIIRPIRWACTQRICVTAILFSNWPTISIRCSLFCERNRIMFHSYTYIIMWLYRWLLIFVFSSQQVCRRDIINSSFVSERFFFLLLLLHLGGQGILLGYLVRIWSYCFLSFSFQFIWNVCFFFFKFFIHRIHLCTLLCTLTTCCRFGSLKSKKVYPWRRTSHVCKW